SRIPRSFAGGADRLTPPGGAFAALCRRAVDVVAELHESTRKRSARDERHPLLDPAEQRNSASEKDRDDGQSHVIDEPGSEKAADEHAAIDVDAPHALGTQKGEKHIERARIERLAVFS